MTTSTPVTIVARLSSATRVVYIEDPGGWRDCSPRRLPYAPSWPRAPTVEGSAAYPPRRRDLQAPARSHLRAAAEPPPLQAGPPRCRSPSLDSASTRSLVRRRPSAWQGVRIRRSSITAPHGRPPNPSVRVAILCSPSRVRLLPSVWRLAERTLLPLTAPRGHLRMCSARATWCPFRVRQSRFARQWASTGHSLTMAPRGPNQSQSYSMEV